MVNYLMIQLGYFSLSLRPNVQYLMVSVITFLKTWLDYTNEELTSTPLNRLPKLVIFARHIVTKHSNSTLNMLAYTTLYDYYNMCSF